MRGLYDLPEHLYAAWGTSARRKAHHIQRHLPGVLVPPATVNEILALEVVEGGCRLDDERAVVERARNADQVVGGLLREVDDAGSRQ
jgi:hypothetical protein